MSEPREWMNRKQAAEYIGVSEVTIWRMEKAGRLQARRLMPNSRPKFSRADIDAAMLAGGEKDKKEGEPKPPQDI